MQISPSDQKVATTVIKEITKAFDNKNISYWRKGLVKSCWGFPNANTPPETICQTEYSTWLNDVYLW